MPGRSSGAKPSSPAGHPRRRPSLRGRFAQTDTAREYFREIVEHAKVPTDEGEATLEDLTDEGEEIPAVEDSGKTPKVPTDEGEEVPVKSKEKVHEARADDRWKVKNWYRYECFRILDFTEVFENSGGNPQVPTDGGEDLPAEGPTDVVEDSPEEKLEVIEDLSQKVRTDWGEDNPDDIYGKIIGIPALYYPAIDVATVAVPPLHFGTTKRGRMDDNVRVLEVAAIKWVRANTKMS